MQSDDTEHAENITEKIRDEDKFNPECQINGPENMSMELEQSGLKRPNMDSDTQVAAPAAVKKSKTNDVIVDTEPLGSPNENHSMDINEERRENHEDMEIYVFVKGDRVDITNVSTSRVFADICDLINRKPVITRSNRSLRILCRNNTEKEILMETNYIAGHRVIFSEPYVKSRNTLYTLNRGIIFGVDEELTEEQISYEIGLPAKRIVKKIGGEMKITRQVILYFEGEIPAHVFFLWRRYKVSVYIPEPTRCFNCQKFGHKANKCNSSSKCPICSGHHSYENCDIRKQNNNKDERRALCPNCKGQHSASYKGCRMYQEAKTIKKIQITESKSYAEALKTLRNKETSDHTVPSNVQPEQIKFTTSDEHSNHVSNDNASRDKINAQQSPSSNEGNVSPINPDHGNTHKNGVNTENLIIFVQSIGVLLSEKNSKEELIAKLYQMAEDFVKSIKQSYGTGTNKN